MDIRRRTIIQLAMAVLVLNGCAKETPAVVPAADASGLPAETGKYIATEKPEPKVRYQFDCSEVDGFRIGTLSSLEEVWASTRYARIDHCRVTYVGGGSHVLTPEEESAVQVAIAQGAPGDDKSALLLRILEVSTRTNPRELDARLPDIGAAVVKGSLAFAPTAPQAAVLERWLKQTTQSAPAG